MVAPLELLKGDARNWARLLNWFQNKEVDGWLYSDLNLMIGVLFGSKELPF